MNIKEGILSVLEKKKAPLTTKEIYDEIINNKICPKLGGKTPAASVNTQCLSLHNENRIFRTKNKSKVYVYSVKKDEFHDERYVIPETLNEIMCDKMVDIFSIDIEKMKDKMTYVRKQIRLIKARKKRIVARKMKLNNNL